MRELRLSNGLSQRLLGIEAGIDEGVASTRINRYEQGVHSPDYLTAKRIARALNVPLPYLYCEDDALAELVASFSAAPPSARMKAIAALS